MNFSDLKGIGRIRFCKNFLNFFFRKAVDKKIREHEKRSNNYQHAPDDNESNYAGNLGNMQYGTIVLHRIKFISSLFRGLRFVISVNGRNRKQLPKNSVKNFLSFVSADIP